MLQRGVMKSGFWAAFIVCGLGELCAAAAIVGWLTDSALMAGVWPSDVNAEIVLLLGGSVDANVLGHPEASLSILAVWVRLVGLTLLFYGLSKFAQCERSSDPLMRHVGLWRTSVVCCGCLIWWLLWLIGDLGAAPLAAFCVGVLPIWMMLLLATFCWIWWQAVFSAQSFEAKTSSQDSGIRFGSIAIVSLAMLSWIGISFWLNDCLYQQLLIPHGDSAMYEEHLWNVWHGKGFRSYLDQGLFLGEHIQVIHLLLLPLHVLWPSHRLLELAESIALGSCCIPIFLIAVRHTKNSTAAALLAIAWLFYFPMHFLDIAIDQKTFRPIALGLPFLFWMIHFAETQRFVRVGICLLLALSAKEDMALLTCPLLAVLAVLAHQGSLADAASPIVADKRARNWLLGFAVFSAVYLVAVVLVIIPAFRSGDHVHYSRYFGDLGGTPGELIKTALTQPMRVVAQFLSVRTLLYLFVFLGPLAFFPMRRPLLLLAGGLTFGMISLLEFGGPEAGGLPPVPYHHFHAPLLAVAFWAGIRAVGNTDSLPKLLRGAEAAPQSLAIWVLFCCVATAATGSLMPFGVGFWSHESAFGYSQLFCPSDPRVQKRAEMAEVVVDMIPLTARVASTDYIHTRLTHCERSYDYSGYLRQVNDYQPGVPADTDYIVIDTGHRYSAVKTAADVRELKSESAEWELLPDVTDGIFLILKRTAH